MATKSPIIDPLEIIGKSIIIPTKSNIGLVESYNTSTPEGYYTIVFFGGMTRHCSLERNFVSLEFLTDSHGVHIGTLEEMKVINN